jgi:hypothetical protein
MKVLLNVALCALAANALDSEAYLNGFSQQLGLDQTVIQDGVNCVAGIQTAVGELIQIVQENENNIPGLLLQAQGLVQELQSKLAFECQPVAEDVATIVDQALDGKDLEQTVKANVELYFPQVVQKVAQYVQYMAHGEAEKAGQTEAYILQVLLGTQQPETLPVPVATHYATYDESDYERLMNEYMPTFYKTLGFENVNVDSLDQCTSEIQKINTYLWGLAQVLPGMELDEKILAVRDFVDVAAEELRQCEEAIEFGKEVLSRVFEAADGNIVGYVLESIENLALNLPEYGQLDQKITVDMQEGEYVQAGKDKARMIQLIDGGRAFPL